MRYWPFTSISLFGYVLPLAGLFGGNFLESFSAFRYCACEVIIWPSFTLGFGEMIRIILLNWYDVTRGPDGPFPAFPRPSFFGLPFTRNPPEGVTAFHQFFRPGLCGPTSGRLFCIS